MPGLHAPGPRRLRRPPRWRLAAAAVAVLGLLVEQVLFGGALLRGDVAVHSAAEQYRQPFLRGVASVLTTLGYYPVVIPVLLLIAALASGRRRTAAPLLLVAAAVAVLGLALATLKVGVGRIGPPAPVTATRNGGSAFPCGPAATTAVVGAVLSMLVPPSARGRFWRPRLFGMTAFVSAAVGASWVYLGRHWLTDVIAAWAVAVLVLCGVAALRPRLEHLASVLDRLPAAIASRTVRPGHPRVGSSRHAAPDTPTSCRRYGSLRRASVTAEGR